MLTCSDPKWDSVVSTCHDHAPVRSRRHLDTLGTKTSVVCGPPRCQRGLRKLVLLAPTPDWLAKARLKLAGQPALKTPANNPGI